MTFQSILMVQIFFMQGKNRLPMGRLALKDRKLLFEYDPEFIKTGLELSPFKLPLQSGVIVNEDHVFGGLFGVFNDSLPDGWGRLLLDRKLMQLSHNPSSLSPLDRLCYVGHQGMGALMYLPELADRSLPHPMTLDHIATEAHAILENDADRFVDDLLAMSGSSSGTRPKIMLTIDEEDWIIKFRSSSDPKDIGAIEYAYHLMAKQAQLSVPPAKLFPAKKGSGYFGVRRFDRIDGHHRHMHTISGLLHIDHRDNSLDYATLMQTTLWLTKDIRECEKQFRAAVFNVLSHNRDDHAKNFSFLMENTGQWHVSPAYDLTFSSGPNGEHCTMVMGEGKNPRISHLLKLAEIAGISSKKALSIITQVRSAIAAWQVCAKDAGVSATSQKMVQNALNYLDKSLFKTHPDN